MLRLLCCFSFFTLSCALPFGGNQLRNYLAGLTKDAEYPFENQMFLPPPFFGPGQLPPPRRLPLPFQNFALNPKRGSPPIVINAYSVKICLPTKGKKSKENSQETKTEAEKTRLSDKADTKVNGRELEPESSVRKESHVETEESNVENENIQRKNMEEEVFEEIQDGDESEVQEIPMSDFEYFDYGNLGNLDITPNLIPGVPE